MKTNFEDLLPSIVKDIANNYQTSDILFGHTEKPLPARKIIIDIIDGIQTVLFPGYFNTELVNSSNANYYIGQKLSTLHTLMKEQIALAIAYNEPGNVIATCEEIQKKSEEICCHFFSTFPKIQELLLLDAKAGYDGDPAALNKEQIIFSYPGFYATYVYRVAHELYKEGVPFIPRIMTEHAHSKTGIDINAGATIGKYFFMDHGTGIVIGETTVIGDYVKLYQGVTLGALSTRGGQHLAGVRRHPTIGDRVTIYSNASVLGGETKIGNDCVIGGGAFITSSIPANTKVSVTPPEQAIKNTTNQSEVSATEYIYEI
ncbi:MAG: serine O-acetyltransferase [Lachnospiraceae bacterium]